jgi:hypothetical protein
MGSLGARGSWLVLVRKDAAGAVSDSEDVVVLGSPKRVAHHQSFDAIRFESAEIPEEVGCALMPAAKTTISAGMNQGPI